MKLNKIFKWGMVLLILVSVLLDTAVLPVVYGGLYAVPVPA